MTKTMPISIDYCIEMARMVWENRDNGTHAWLELADGRYLTIEPEQADFNEDVLEVILTPRTDMLGYAVDVLNICSIWSDDIDDDEALYKIFNYVLYGEE